MRAVIFANGGFTRPPAIPPADLIIAADGGARFCLELGLIPHLVVGDFDSLDESQLAILQAAGSQLIRYPQRKDFTDLELAFQHAIERGADEILVLAALGGRWDQTFANLILPAADGLAGMRISLIDSDQTIHFVRAGERLEINGSPGDTVSLIPLKGDAVGITTDGLEYPLVDETLHFGGTRGISNVLLGESAWVELREGMLLCVIIHH